MTKDDGLWKKAINQSLQHINDWDVWSPQGCSVVYDPSAMSRERVSRHENVVKV
jgi:hypothetical protein